jgi:hypothetical protein
MALEAWNKAIVAKNMEEFNAERNWCREEDICGEVTCFSEIPIFLRQCFSSMAETLYCIFL